MSHPRRANLVRALSQDPALRQAGLALIIDQTLASPFGELIDRETLCELILTGCAAPTITPLLEQHLRPAWQRYQATCAAHGETLGRAVPDDARAALHQLVLRPDGPRGAWLQAGVNPTLVRQLLAPVLQEVLLSFTRKLPLMGGDSDSDSSDNKNTRRGALSGLKARVKRRAGQVLDAGKNVGGGLIQRTARDFSQTALDEARVALDIRLASTEGQQLLLQISRQLVDHVLDTPLETIHADISRLPEDDIWALVPPILSHNAARPELRDIILAEIDAFLALEQTRSVADWLRDAGLLDDTRAALISQLDATAVRLFSADPFGEWLDALLTRADAFEDET